MATLAPGVTWHAASHHQPRNERLELAAAFEAISRLQLGHWSLDAVITSLTLLSRHPSSEAAKIAGETLVSSIDRRPSLAAALRAAVHEASSLNAAHRKGLLRVVAQVESVAGVQAADLDFSEDEGNAPPSATDLGSSENKGDAPLSQTPSTNHGGGRSSGGRWDRFPRPAYDGWRDAGRMPVDASYPFTTYAASTRHPAPDAYGAVHSPGAAWPHDGDGDGDGDESADGDGDDGAEEYEGAEESEGIGLTMATPAAEGGAVGRAHSRGRVPSRRAAWLADSTRRLHADQQGWRSEEAQQATRGKTLRGWVAATTSRDEKAAPLQADIVRGLWTCCKQIDPKQPGCVTTSHTTAEQRCERCASWVPRAKWDVEACVAHAAECRWLRYHGVVWPCCGDASLKHTRWATRTPEDWLARRGARLSTHEWETKCNAEGFLGSGGGDGTHSYSYHLHTRAIKPPGCGAKPPCFGCRKLSKHTAAPLPCCPSCKHASQGRDDKRCPSCGTEQQLCTQCQRWVPLSAWGEERACTFHPGVWCADRPVRQVRVHGRAPHSEEEEEEGEEEEEEVSPSPPRPPRPPEVRRVPPYFGMPTLYLAIPSRVPKPPPKPAPKPEAATWTALAWLRLVRKLCAAKVGKQLPTSRADAVAAAIGSAGSGAAKAEKQPPKSHTDAVAAVLGGGGSAGRGGRGGRGGRAGGPKPRPDEPLIYGDGGRRPKPEPDEPLTHGGGGGGGGGTGGSGGSGGGRRPKPRTDEPPRPPRLSRTTPTSDELPKKPCVGCGCGCGPHRGCVSRGYMWRGPQLPPHELKSGATISAELRAERQRLSGNKSSTCGEGSASSAPPPPPTAAARRRPCVLQSSARSVSS